MTSLGPGEFATGFGLDDAVAAAVGLGLGGGTGLGEDAVGEADTTADPRVALGVGEDNDATELARPHAITKTVQRAMLVTHLGAIRVLAKA